MKKLIFAFTAIAVLSSCIGDDFLDDRVDPVLRISGDIDTLEINTTFQLEFRFLNNVGAPENVDVTWLTSDNNVATVTNTGLITAVGVGDVLVSGEYTTSEGILVSDEVAFSVGMSTVVMEEEEEEEEIETRSGRIETTTFYTLEGDFTMSVVDDVMTIEIADDWAASSGLPGLFVYLSNNRNSIANALEISEVRTFRGAHSFTVEGVGLDDYSHLLYFCKPFNVKVGDGAIQ